MIQNKILSTEGELFVSKKKLDVLTESIVSKKKTLEQIWQ